MRRSVHAGLICVQKYNSITSQRLENSEQMNGKLESARHTCRSGDTPALHDTVTVVGVFVLIRRL